MQDWKVGDKVAITQYSTTLGVDTVVEITKGGNIRLSKSDSLYNQFGSLRGAGKWSSTHIHKITDKEYDDYLITQKIKAKRKKIIEKLNSIKESELMSYWAKIDKIYDDLIED